MARPSIPEAIDALSAASARFSSADVTEQTGLSRQAVHRHLRRRVEAGALMATGRGRARRYQRPASWQQVFAPKGLEEDVVWASVVDSGLLVDLPQNAWQVLQYAFTEMLNNAIDHANARSISVEVSTGTDRAFFEIIDDGYGAFRRVREALNLQSELEALQELSKGRVTTLPDRHTGEGVFFTSKAVSVFALETGSLRWVVDNERRDLAVLDVAPRPGTLVRCELAFDLSTTLDEVFAQYTRDFEFSVSRTYVKLFEFGVRFVSRSEAKRLSRRLDGFAEVVIDFEGVLGVGQGFCDELFRVWAKQHPGTRLVPAHMGPSVEHMVRRALRT